MKQGSARVSLKGRVSFQWQPYTAVHFSGRAPRGAPGLDLEEVELLTPRGEAGRGILASIRLMGAGATEYAGELSSPFRLGRVQPAMAIKFHLVNFHEYRGSGAIFGRPPAQRVESARIEMADGQWSLQLDQLPTLKTGRRSVEAFGGWAIGHVGLIRRLDGRSITPDEFSEVLARLHYFFGFARGLWCGPVIPCAAGRRRVLWSEWGSWILSPRCSIMSWFPKMQPKQLTEAFAGFQRLSDDPIWSRPLRTAIHWYVEANSHAGGVSEGAIIFAQAGLELLSWVRLVEEKKRYSSREFDRMKAADKIRHLLDEFSVPRGVPTEYAELRSVTGPSTFVDGPGAVVALRNAVVHPNLSKRQRAAKFSGIVKFQMLQTALGYLELVPLALMGYRGKYTRRLLSGLESAAVDDVPWR